MKKIWYKLFDLDKPMQYALFNIITMLGMLGCFVSQIMTMSMNLDISTIIPVIAIEIIGVVCIYIANWKGKIILASVFVCGGVTMLVVPVLFFSNGGVHGGISMWMLFGIMYTVLLTRGRAFGIILTLQIILYTICFYVAYTYPGIVINFGSEGQIYKDVWQSLFIVALGISAIIKFQMWVYDRFNKQLQKAKEETEIAREEALKANREKSEFLARMSHEIRTPINAVLGMDEMILRESSETEILTYAKSIQGAGKTLITLINDILDFSKIESGKMEIIPVEYDMYTLVNDCSGMVSLLAREKALEFILDIQEDMPSKFFGDEVRINQIMLNFLTNAVKYTQKGSVTFSLSYDKIDEENINLKISVKDTGIGIKAEAQSTIFDSFKRVDDKKVHKIEGSGLGLSIAKQLSEKMNGKVSVNSVYGVGSEFCVELPQKVVDYTPMKKINSNLKIEKEDIDKYSNLFTAPDAKLLVVDDVSVNLQVVKSLLKVTKVKIDEATSGYEAVELVRKNKYHLILMDHMMPGMNGIETLKKMQEINDNLSKDAPVIMLTANAIAGMKEEYLTAGFDDYIPKPIEGQNLERIIRKHLPKELISQSSEKLVTSNQSQEADKIKNKDLKLLLPLFDKELALKYCCDSEEILIEVMEEYVNDNRIELIEKYYEEKDWENYAIQLHALKSTSMTIGLRNLSEKAKSLEMAAKENIETIIDDKHDDTMYDYEQAIEKIKKYLQNIK